MGSVQVENNEASCSSSDQENKQNMYFTNPNTMASASAFSPTMVTECRVNEEDFDVKPLQLPFVIPSNNHLDNYQSQPPASLSRQQTHDDGAAADDDSFELYRQVIESQLGEISNPKRVFQVFIKMCKKITDLKKQH